MTFFIVVCAWSPVCEHDFSWSSSMPCIEPSRYDEKWVLHLHFLQENSQLWLIVWVLLEGELDTEIVKLPVTCVLVETCSSLNLHFKSEESRTGVELLTCSVILSIFFAWKYEHDFCIIGAEHFLHMSIDYRTQIHRCRRGPKNNLETWKFIQIKLTKNDTNCTLYQA
jgi:hypothetical protein